MVSLELVEINWGEVTFNLSRMGLAYILALPIALNREKEAKSAGLRTFPLVSVAACGYMLTGMGALEGSQAHSRVVYGIITGIGFIGGGAILKSKEEVIGTATAASIWCTGAIGIAVAWTKIEIAVLLSVLNFLTFVVKPAAKNLAKNNQ